MVLTPAEEAAARKEQEAQDFAARMNAKYNNNSTQRATDEYDRRYGNPKTETPDFQKHLQTPVERIRTGTSSFLRSAGHYAATAASYAGHGIKTAAQKTSSYTKKKSAEHRAYISSPEYKQKQAEKAEARKERKENFRKRMAESKKRYQQQNGINSPTYQRQHPSRQNQPFSLFGPSPGGFGFPQQPQNPRRKAQKGFQIGGIAGSVPSLFEAPRQRAPKAKKGRKQYRQRRPPRGGIIDSMPVIGGF